MNVKVKQRLYGVILAMFLTFMLTLLQKPESTIIPIDATIQEQTEEIVEEEPVTLVSTAEEEPKNCDGNWVKLDSTNKIDLQFSSISEWGLHTPPSFLTETTNNDSANIVAIGHNICQNGNCYKAGSEFGKIINSQIGDKAEMCLNNTYHSGNVVHSAPVPETAMYVLNNWLNRDSVTLFTSYGQCKDSSCNVTYERWVVAFERAPF